MAQIISMKQSMDIMVKQILQENMSMRIVIMIAKYDQNLVLEVRQHNETIGRAINYEYISDQDGQDRIKIETTFNKKEKLMIRVKDTREEKNGIMRLAYCVMQYIDEKIGVVCIDRVQSMNITFGAIENNG